MMRAILFALLLPGCLFRYGSARLQMSNDTPVARTLPTLADGTSLRLKIIAVYLAQDVDPVTMNNIGNTAMIYLNPECGGDIENCNIDGFTDPVGGPRVKEYFDLARPTAEVDAQLNAQVASVDVGSYRYARVEMCKSYDRSLPTVPSLMWKGPGMSAEHAFTSGDCGRTSQAFAPTLDLASGDSVAVTLGYDLAQTIVTGPRDTTPGACGYSVAGYKNTDGTVRCFRECDETDPANRVCMDFPDFRPSATKL
jgi:hypothetical protein